MSTNTIKLFAKSFLVMCVMALIFIVPLPIHAQEVTGDAAQTTEATAEQADPVGATEAPKVSLVWRVIQIIAFAGVLFSLAGMIYGIVMWRNGTQNNDVILVDRGRRITLLYGIIFIIFLILLIVSFIVIRRQKQAVQPPPQAAVPAGVGGLVSTDALLLIEVIPLGNVPIRNVQVQMIFNQTVAQTAIEENVLLRKQEDQSALVGEWTVDQDFVTFVPNTTCPTPHTNLRCFDANTTFEVVVYPDMTSIDGDSFRCSASTASGECKFAFTTGDKIDVESPSVEITLPFDGAGVPVDSSVLVEALGKDDVGVGTIHFMADDERFGIASSAGGELEVELRTSSSWETLDLLINSMHNLKAKIFDIAGSSGTSKEVSVEILPVYCFDGVQNEDEEGLDCGGPTCRVCQGGECSQNSDCASGLCFEGVCQEFPVIQEVIEDNGKPGNYISIRGQNFGNETGQVIFLGESGDADDVPGVYPQCEVFWGNGEVIIEIPEGSITGPIKIITADNLYDTTDDNKGLRLHFEVNDIAHPSLCSVNPSSQIIGEIVALQGKDFGEEVDDVIFDKFSSGRIEGWADSSISSVAVPSLEPGQMFVKVKVGDDFTNPVLFEALKSPTLPRISSIAPDNGPVGQMFSLTGENLATQALLVKFYNPETGEETLADTRLPDSCLKFQSATQRAFRVPRVDPGPYQVFAESELGQSNSVDFTVNLSDKLPGLCAMNPDNGPLGLEIALYGEGFGSSTGAVRFNPRIDDAAIISWSDGVVKVNVPPNAQTGPVNVIHSAGALSNPMVYTVGQCSPDTAADGFQCCSDGSYKVTGACVDTVPFCTYSWVFSTGDDLGGPPRVIEDALCKTNTQSPSPYRDTKDGCINATISARFTHDMKNNTLSRDNITVRKCNSGQNLNSAECNTVIQLSGVQMINAEQPGEGFIAVPQLQLEPGTWYKVELSDSIQAENELFLAQPYSWVFRVQEGDGACEVDHVEVTPPNAILKQLGVIQEYSGVPTALNCNVLNPESFNWHWLSSDTSKASITSTTESRTNATSVGPTDPGPPVEILGGIPDASAEDKGLLSILLQSPQVVDKWPNCSSACVNSYIGARFDQEMDVNSVTSDANVLLYQCIDPVCARAELQKIGVISLRYNETDYEIYFLPTGETFTPGSSYRVVLSGLRSSSTLPLGGINYDLDGDGGVDSYSWVFTVREESDLCAIDDVRVVPPFVVSYLIGDKYNYFGIPVSPPDACSSSGQMLNPETYDWGWSSADTGIGQVTSDDNFSPEALIDPYQVTTSVGAGDTKIRANAQGVLGDGDFSVVCGYENDNDCPAPATLTSHAVGSDSCCHARPAIEFVNPKEGSDQVCTTLAVEVQFDQMMDVGSLVSNVFLEYNNGATPCPGDQTTAWNKARNLAKRLFAWLVPTTNAQASNWCSVEASVSAKRNSVGSVVQVSPKVELKKSAQYRVRVRGDMDLTNGVSDGVRNRSGVSYTGEFTSGFATGDAKCSLEILEVVITPPGESGSKDVFFCAGRDDCTGDANEQVQDNQHGYQVIGRDLRGYVVPAEFRWGLSGAPLVTLDTDEGDYVEATSGVTNGETVVTVYARALPPSDGLVARSLDVKVFICENPWPSIEGFPYADPEYNFDIFYCRDFGDPGTHDDLPPLKSPIIGANIGEILQESLFIIE